MIRFSRQLILTGFGKTFLNLECEYFGRTSHWIGYAVISSPNIREFTKPWRQRRGQRQLKNDLYFTNKSRDTLKSFTLFLTVKTIAKLIPEHSDNFEIKI